MPLNSSVVVFCPTNNPPEVGHVEAELLAFAAEHRRVASFERAHVSPGSPLSAADAGAGGATFIGTLTYPYQRHLLDRLRDVARRYPGQNEFLPLAVIYRTADDLVPVTHVLDERGHWRSC